MNELKMIENELVPVYETSTGERVVNCRELWTILKSKRQFSDWINGRIEDCEAVEKEDFQTFSQKNEKGRPTIEYIIKLDIAKEMAMLERNEIGKRVRKYFIEIEKKYKENKHSLLLIPFTEIVQSIDIVASSLKVNDASKILMYDKLYSSYGVSTEFLPKYKDSGSREIRPATELLKRIGSKMKTATFNQILIKNEYMEERTRKSTKSDELRYFKALTEKGLQYGENLISPRNQKEVQPYYYADTFQELYNLVTEKVDVLA